MSVLSQYGPWTHGSLKVTLKDVRRETEREMIELALKHTGGNVTHSAMLLDISRRGIQTKMREQDIDPEEYRGS